MLASVDGLKAADDPRIERLDVRGHVGLEEDESDVLGLVGYLMSREVVQGECNLSILSPQLNVPLLNKPRLLH
jgi:hypothetical protein